MPFVLVRGHFEFQTISGSIQELPHFELWERGFEDLRKSLGGARTAQSLQSQGRAARNNFCGSFFQFCESADFAFCGN